MGKQLTQHMKFHWMLVVPLFIILVAIASPELDAVLEQIDENHSYRHIGLFDYRNNVFEIIQSIASTSNQHVPVYYLALGVWINLTGPTLYVMRTLSLFAGLLTIALGYGFTKNVFNKRVALWVAVGISTMAFFIQYTHEIRMYMFMLLTSLILYWCYWRIVSVKRVSLLGWVALYASGVTVIYTHVFGIFPLLAIGVYHLLTFSRKSKRWWTSAGVFILVGLSFVPWIPVFMGGIETRVDLTNEEIPLGEVIRSIIEIYTNGFIPFAIVYGIAVLSLLGSLWKRRNLLYVTCVAVVPIVTLVAIDEAIILLVKDTMRYTVILIPSFVLLFAVGLDLVFRRFKYLVPVLIAVWCVTGVNFLGSVELLEYANKNTPRLDEHPPIHEIMQYMNTVEVLPDPEKLFTITPTRNFKSLMVEYYSNMMPNEYIHIGGDLVKAGVDGFDESKLFQPRDYQKYDVNKLEDRIELETMPSFWLGYTPKIDPTTIWVYENILAKYHRYCTTYVDTAEMKLVYFVKNDLPCELFELHTRGQDHESSLWSSYYALVDEQLEIFCVYDINDVPELYAQLLDANGQIVVEEAMETPYDNIAVHSIDVSDIASGTYIAECKLASNTLELGNVIIQ